MTPKERLEYLRKQKRLQELRAKKTGSAPTLADTSDATPPNVAGEQPSLWQDAKDFVGSTVASAEDLLPGIGVVDKIGAASYAAQQELGDLFRDEKDQRDFSDRYDEQVKASADQRQARKEKSDAGQLAGTALGLPLAALATPVPGVNAAKLGAAGNAVVNAGARLATGAGLSAADQGTRNPDELFDTGAAMDGAETALKYGAAFESLPLAARAAKPVAKGAARFLGIGNDSIENYLKTPGKYNDPDLTAPNVQEKLDAPLRHIQERAAAAKEGVAGAKDSYKMARMEYIQKLRDQGVPDDVISGLQAALKQQRKNISDLTQRQYEELSKSGAKLKLSDLDHLFASSLDKRRINGQVLPQDQEATTIKELRGMLESLQENSDEIDPESFAKLRKVIDGKIRAAYTGHTGGHTSAGNALGKEVRTEINRMLDTQLPNSGEAQKVRQELARNVELGERASKAFGKDDPRGVLAGLADPNNKSKRALLDYLDKKTGGQIMPKLQPYLDAQRQLQNKPALERGARALPEAGKVREAQAAMAEAQAAQKAVGGLTPDSSQAAMRRLMFENARKPEVRTKEAVDAASEYAKKHLGSTDDLRELVNDLKVKTEFEGGSPNGSRLVNTGRAIGRATGLPGAEAAGALVGGAVDYGRGKTAKAALDVYLGAHGAANKVPLMSVAPFVAAVSERAESDPEAAKFAQVLDQASQRGPEAMLAAHQVLLKNPKYRDLVRGEQEM